LNAEGQTTDLSTGRGVHAERERGRVVDGLNGLDCTNPALTPDKCAIELRGETEEGFGGRPERADELRLATARLKVVAP
jgi:hypothetical protein